MTKFYFSLFIYIYYILYSLTAQIILFLTYLSFFSCRSSVAVVNVNIQDINNNAPEFIGAPYEAFIGESLPPGALVYQLQVKL